MFDRLLPYQCNYCHCWQYFGHVFHLDNCFLKKLYKIPSTMCTFQLRLNCNNKLIKKFGWEWVWNMRKDSERICVFFCWLLLWLIGN